MNSNGDMKRHAWKSSSMPYTRGALSYCADPASTQDKPWPSIPEDNLMKVISERTAGALVRSDSIPVAGAPSGPTFGLLPPQFVEGDESKGEYWIDYKIA